MMDLPTTQMLGPDGASGLRLRVLGRPEILVDGQSVKIGVKSVALLAYLALEGPMLRRVIAQQLWPESGDILNNLSVARNNMTRSLGFDPLVYDEDRVWLTPGFSCDALEWRNDTQTRDETAWRRAWQAWDGGFLQGFQLTDWNKGLGEEFEEWVLETREAFEAQRRELAANLAASVLERDDPALALPYLEAAQGEQEPREDAARWLILILGILGEGHRAASVYANLTRALREELEVEPTQATRNALEAARSSQTHTCHALLEQEFTARGSKPTAPSVETDVPFVGREREREALFQEFELVRPNTARLVILTGEPGAGKTRLTQELERHLQRSRTKPLAAHGVAAPTGLPLTAFDRVARQLVAERPNVLEALPIAHRDALARFLPDLRGPNLPEPAGMPANPELERRSLFEAIRALLTHPDRATLLVLDDLQWADAGTLELLLHLLRNPSAHGLCVVGTLRSTETPSRDLKTVLEAQARELLGPIIRLEPLTEDACASLAQSLGRDDDPAKLRRSTGGNPFYLIELLRAEPGVAARRVQDLLRARLELLSEVERQTLEAIAVLGDGASTGLIRRTSGRSLEEITDALERLVRLGLLRAEGDGFAFFHDLAREVVGGDLSSPRRALLNLRAARSIADAPERAANHYWASKDVWDDVDEASAVTTFVESGSRLSVRGDLENALGWFDRVPTVSAEPVGNVKALTQRARVLRKYARYEDAATALQSAEARIQEVDPVTAASVWNTHADLLLDHFGDAQTANDYTDRALQMLEPLTASEAASEQAWTHHLKGWSAYLKGDYATAKDHYLNAIRIRRKLENPVRLAESLNTLGQTLVFAGNPDAIASLTEAMEIAQGIGDQSLLAHIYSSIGIHYRRVNQPNDALYYLRQAIELRSQYDVERGAWLNNLANVHFDLGQFWEARAWYERAIASQESAKHVRHRAWFYANLGETNLQLGLFGDARTAFAQALLLTSPDMTLLRTSITWFLGELDVIAGELLNAQAQFRQSLEIASPDHATQMAMALGRLARLELNPALAQQALEYADTPVLQASLQFAQKDFAGAETIIQAANTYEVARLKLDLGLLLEQPTVAEAALHTLATRFNPD